MRAFLKNWLLFFLTMSMLTAPGLGLLLHGGEDAFFDDWSADQPYTADYAVTLNKKPGKDFVVLNLADIQLGKSAMGKEGALVRENTDRIVAETKPDLITLSGDNAWSTWAYIQLINMIDAYGVPWAPVMGNHDGQGTPGEFWCAYNMAQAKNCLFKFGPKDMGYGNYIINIAENGDIIHTLYMMDTHSDIEEDGINGPAGGGYDHLWPNQFAWYAWAVDGTEALAGHPVESTVIFHIPLVEYRTAWEAATGTTGESDAVRDAEFVGEYADSSFGTRHEIICSAPENNGFFALIKEKGSTKNVICGHDHVNDYSILYDGVRLTYGVKDGPGCYWDPALNGGTTLSIASDGTGTVAHHFVEYPEWNGADC